MTDYTRYVENRLEQFKLKEEFNTIMMKWIQRNVDMDRITEVLFWVDDP